MIRGRIAEVGEVATRLDASANLPEGTWTSTRLLREALAEKPLDRPTDDALSALLARASRLAAHVEETALMLGARFAGVAPATTEVARAGGASVRADRLAGGRRAPSLAARAGRPGQDGAPR